MFCNSSFQALFCLIVQKSYIGASVKKYFQWAVLNRLEAMTMLKELVANDLVEPSYVSMVKVDSKSYQIQIKCDYNKPQIESYAKKHGLTMTEDIKRKYLVIFKQ
jgi:hypothetical protein